MTSNLLDEKAAAAFLDLSPATLRTWRCREKGPAFYRLSRGPNGIKYSLEDLAAFRDASRHVPATVRASKERGHGDL